MSGHSDDSYGVVSQGEHRMRKFFGFLGLALCVAATLLAIQSRAPKYGKSIGLAKAAPASAAHASMQYGKLPLSFEPNLGQFSPEAKFLAHGDGYSLFLTSNEAVLVLRDSSKGKSAVHAHPDVLRMQLVGTNPSATFSAIDELPGKANYFIGHNQADWHTNVPMYRKVAEGGVYPGVDLVYYGTQRQIEYDFIVAPGADVASIRLSIQGGKNLKIDNQGELVVSSQGGDVVLHKPVVYQEAGKEKQMVAASYAINSNNEVHFEIGTYNRTRALVIDPILAYSTYLGGSNIDGANAIAVATDNTAFIAGGTFSTNFPTSHPLQANDGGGPDFPQDAFVTKFSADGSTLLYSTYLGGTNEDVANGIAIDTAGNAYITGTTLSPNFPVNAGSFNTLCGGDGKCGASFNSNGFIVSNGFLTKLNAAGSAIIYSGFIGSFENVGALAVAVDANQNAYVTGQTQANDFASSSSGTPLTIPIAPSPGGAISNGNGTSTIFFTSGIFVPVNSLVTITGVGGTQTDPNPPSPYDGIFTVITSAPGSIIIGTNGGAASGNGTVAVNPAPPFPITTTALQLHFGGGATDAFVMKISATGNDILYSTYLGGTGGDVGNAIAVDKNADAYVTGLTYSTGFPLSATPFQAAFGGAGDAFVSEINTDASGAAGLVYSTYLGGAGLDQGNGIAVDSTTCAVAGTATACQTYVAGGTASTGLGTAGSFQPDCDLGTTNQCSDAFVAEFNPGATGTGSLLFFTYLGGSLSDSAAAVALDTSLNIYVAGSTLSQDFPIVGAAFQPVYGGGNDDAFVAKLNPTGTALAYSSYLGGTDTDNAYGIAVDASGSAYVAGQTCSTNFPVSNPEQVSPGGDCDAFISKVKHP